MNVPRTVSSFLAFFAMAVFPISAETKREARIDAVTAATVNNQCQFVFPIVVTGSTAAISWTFDHTGGSGIFKYWTSPTDTVTITLSASERTSMTIVLTGLKPATQYNIYLLLSKTGETSAAATGAFTTSSTSVHNGKIEDGTEKVTRLRGKAIFFGREVRPGDNVTVFDFRGRKILMHRVTEGEGSCDLPANANSAVVIRIAGHGTVRNNARTYVLHR
jgi:hypothetical protein